MNWPLGTSVPAAGQSWRPHRHAIGDLFTDRERAALELAEAITSLHDGHVPDAVYANAAEVFTEKELAQVIALAVTINAWNRFNVATRMPAPRR